MSVLSPTIVRIRCGWLNGKHVVFGTGASIYTLIAAPFIYPYKPKKSMCAVYLVVDGLRVLRAIEAVGSLDGTPTEAVIIADCGELEAL